MLTAKMTPNLTGIELEGEWQDFRELEDAVDRMAILDFSKESIYWGVVSRMQKLSEQLCYTHLGMEQVALAENGVDFERMRHHGMIMPGQNLHYRMNLLAPEAFFLALAIPSIYSYASLFYGRPDRQHRVAGMEEAGYSTFLQDKAILDLFCATLLHTIGEVIGDLELELFLRFRETPSMRPFDNYVTHYLDLCNVEYLKASVAKRPSLLKFIGGCLLSHQAMYLDMERDLQNAAKLYHCTIYDLELTKIQYPDEIQW